MFVANGPDTAEDDGVLMGYVYDRASDRSDLVLLDAGTLGDVAAVHLPARVPQGFHGNWVLDRLALEERPDLRDVVTYDVHATIFERRTDRR